MLFLIDYDRASGKVVSLRSFGDGQAAQATQARLELELKLNREGLEHEVVVFDAPSEAVLRRTHARYFSDTDEIINAIQG